MLTSEEFEKIKLHPERGAWLMGDSFFPKPLIPYCLYHHERYDGTGYPFGLNGRDIPMEGRLIAVADAFDALTSNRKRRICPQHLSALSATEKSDCAALRINILEN